jgi:hypothetical protein
MTSCPLASSLCNFSRSYCLFLQGYLELFHPEEEAVTMLRNVGKYSPRDTASQRHISGGFIFQQLPFNIFILRHSADDTRGGIHFLCLWKLDSWVN